MHSKQGRAGWESALSCKTLQQNDSESWFICTCKSLTNKNEPIALYSFFLLGYGQQMYHTSENFCDAEKCLQVCNWGVLWTISVLLKCDVIIRVFFRFVMLWTKSIERFMKFGNNCQLFYLNIIYTLYNMYIVCII